MRILITNDDGIAGEGLEILTRFAQKIGDVTVMAPKYEQSGKSHAINLRTPFEIKAVDYLRGVRAFTVDSTPADCIRVATGLFCEKYDLVLSGINKGYNVGEDIVYSGTCAAVFEAAYFGFPAVAVSTDPDQVSESEKSLQTVYDYFRENHLLDYHGIYNVNLPPHPTGVRITREGGPYFRDKFAEVGSDMYLAKGYSAYQKTDDMTLDTNATFGGFISISPLTAERTCVPVFDKLKSFLP